MHSREELFREAQRQVAARRQQAVTLAQQVSEQAYQAIPELRACEDEITRLGFERAQLAAKGANAEALAQAKQRQQQARTRREELLKANGYASAALGPRYVCPRCRDTGVHDGKVCSCVLR